jgi:hypothetical protein
MSNPVRVTLTVSDANKVPVRVYTKVIEFDREDWDEWNTATREWEIETQLREYRETLFEADYTIDEGS